jgi:hypothetical protein
MSDQDILFGLKSSCTTSQFASLVNIFKKKESVPLTRSQKFHLRKPNKLKIKMSTYPAANGE